MSALKNFSAIQETPNSSKKPTLSTISDFDSKYGMSSTKEQPSPPRVKRSFFSIDFEDPRTAKADKCLINKTKTMKVGDFWDELTKNSQRKLISSFRLAKLSLPKFLDHSKHLRVMFRKPDVCCQEGMQDNSKYSLNFLKNMSFKGNNSLFYSNLNEVGMFSYNIYGNYGNFSKVYLPDSQNSTFYSSICNIGESGNLLALGCVKQGSVNLYDLKTCSKILKFETGIQSSSSVSLVSKDNLIASLDNSCVVSLFDMRMNNRIGQIKDFKGFGELPISFDLEGRSLLFGTTEGPISFDITQIGEKRKRHKFEKSGVFNKSLFLNNSSNFIVNGEIGSNCVSVITDFKDDEIEPDIDVFEFGVEKLIDFDVCKDSSQIALLCEIEGTLKFGEKRSKMVILEPEKKSSKPSFKIKDEIELEGEGLRIAFTREMDLFALTTKDWNIFNCKNSHFVKSLVEKVTRKRRAKRLKMF